MKREGIRVLVADDSPSARELLVALLQNSEGFQVVGVASTGEEVVRLTKRPRGLIALWAQRTVSLPETPSRSSWDSS